MELPDSYIYCEKEQDLHSCLAQSFSVQKQVITSNASSVGRNIMLRLTNITESAKAN